MTPFSRRGVVHAGIQDCLREKRCHSIYGASNMQIMLLITQSRNLNQSAMREKGDEISLGESLLQFTKCNPCAFNFLSIVW
jgi:hypothetical protein